MKTNFLLSTISFLGIDISEIEIYKMELIDYDDFIELVLRFGLNLIVCVIIVRTLYFGVTRRKDYLFTYFLINTTVFLLCFLLESVKLELGFALGLFAVFGIIRYRTTTIPIREMTYLFIIIGLSVINALANKKISYAELIFTNMAVILIIYGLEKLWLLKSETSKTVVFEKIDLVKPENYQLLLDDLSKRTGIEINRVEVGKINFLRDTAELKIYYDSDIVEEDRVEALDEDLI